MKIVDAIMTLLRKIFKDNIRFLRYSLIGCTGATLDFILFNILIYFDIHYHIANIIGVCLGITNNYFLNARYNFKVTSEPVRRYISFLVIGILGLVLSVFILFILVETYGVNVVVAKLGTIFLIALIQFGLNSSITFRQNW